MTNMMDAISTQNHKNNQLPWWRILALEVILERIPGEAWGLCWHRTAFDEERQVIFPFPVHWPCHGENECQPMLNLYVYIYIYVYTHICSYMHDFKVAP